MFLTTTATRSVGRRVSATSLGYLIPTATRITYTDGDGVAEFDDVPVCTVELYVNGEHQLNVGVGTSDHEDVTVTL